jgi:hypothetical protein
VGRSGDPRKRAGWHNTGIKVMVPESALSGERLDRAVEELKPGEHLWISVTVHRVDPERMRTPGHTTYLDSENLLQAGAVGCFVCELPYARAKDRVCPGGGHD